MVYRRKKFAPKGVAKKRKFIRRKRRYVRRVKAQIRQVGFGFPTNKVFNLRYVTPLTLTGNAGVMARWTYRANSIYDPDYTGGGGQPRSHDELAKFYSRYVVLGSKITVTNNDSYTTGQALPFVFGVQLCTSDDFTPESWLAVMEQGRDKFRVCNLNTNRGMRVTKGYSMKKFFKIRDVRDNMLTHGAHFGSNPTEEAYFVVFQQDYGMSANQVNKYIVCIDYCVMLTEPKGLNAS